jgi:holliday junction DNA helicase RuvB
MDIKSDSWTKGEFDEVKDQNADRALRPKSFADFPGQEATLEKLKISVQAARSRESSLDHVLLSGPPGLGKTTLAQILANEMQVPFKATSAPAISRKGDLAALLTSLEPNSILFIDEIHRLHSDIEEYLYSAMEDFFIDLITGEGLGAQSMRFQISPFTLVGATTRSGLLKAPFRDRFGIHERLQFYSPDALVKIIERSTHLLDIELDADSRMEVAKRSRGTPRVANRFLRRIRDYAEVKGQKIVDKALADFALRHLEVDDMGLERMDRSYLWVLKNKFSGGPAGIDTMAAALSEEKDTLEDVYEPFLIKEGLIRKTSRGREITELGIAHLNSSDFVDF